MCPVLRKCVHSPRNVDISHGTRPFPAECGRSLRNAAVPCGMCPFLTECVRFSGSGAPQKGKLILRCLNGAPGAENAGLGVHFDKVEFFSVVDLPSEVP